MSADSWAVCPRCAANHAANDTRFREDYEIGGAETGTVTVSYRGECQQCGLLLEFKAEHPIPDWQPKNEPTGPITKRAWSAIPAGWFVQAPNGAWYEVVATSGMTGAMQDVTIIVNGVEATHPRPASSLVPARRGTLVTEVSDALDALGEGARVVEDRL
jgi:hypothetical protein